MIPSRAEWSSDDNTRAVESIRRRGLVGPLGYVNVAHQRDGLAIRRGTSPSPYSTPVPLFSN